MTPQRRSALCQEVWYPSFKNSSELDNLTKNSPGVAAL